MGGHVDFELALTIYVHTFSNSWEILIQNKEGSIARKYLDKTDFKDFCHQSIN